ncbi:hypothetical protein F0M18_13615 [Pseudohalioglobus sediminis]|uniref:Uncharacterized protein n=1 Tax=Pseudohalioglobus sediminis TaxID=2606449 RepID=A0A5B0WUF5_9GAMM|nr:hypothetical protein [Pseudohalioglobus sediminis]KAA1190098.1 hypothetical protein F0M18_13615 [Pseudohalioglobus sediminis]
MLQTDVMRFCVLILVVSVAATSNQLDQSNAHPSAVSAVAEASQGKGGYIAFDSDDAFLQMLASGRLQVFAGVEGEVLQLAPGNVLSKSSAPELPRGAFVIEVQTLPPGFRRKNVSEWYGVIDDHIFEEALDALQEHPNAVVTIGDKGAAVR